jgi:homoserine dehydrogenase
VGGIDAGHKLALLAALAFGCKVDFDGVAIEGIERVTLADIRHAGNFGYAIKLLGVARREAAGIVRSVQPCLVRAESAIGQLPGVTNAVVCEGDFVGQCVFEGPGAGEGPTASAVVADLIDIARGNTIPPFGVAAGNLAPLDGAAQPAPAPHYLRFRLQDRPGALATIAQALGEEAVSIRSMHQDGEVDGAATVVILTHACDRPALDRALDAIAARPVCLDAPVALRIEEV